jgi:alanyl-tRNA synthetase
MRILLGAQGPADVPAGAALVARDGPGLSGAGRAEALISETLKLEETRFRKTLDRGLSLLDEASADLSEGDRLRRDGVQAL